jgi:RNA polymerase sigma-70 factor (ECF subfamily)
LEEPTGSLGVDDGMVRLRADLARAVVRVCPSWLASRSEDLVQIAMMRVVEVQKRSEGTAELSSSYLKKAAYSAVVDEIRCQRRRSEVPLEQEPHALDRSTARPDPERCAEGREVGGAIRRCLGRLVKPRRLAVTLHLQGHSVPQAAQLLGWKAKRAENLVYRGLADLRECLAAAGVKR